jgi:hypothetical protein
MVSFFSKDGNSVESGIKAAIAANDVKLIQIFLGPTYCQIWQYWAVQAMISHNMLAVERTVSCNFTLNVCTKQIEILERQKELLSRQQKLL